MFPQSIYLLYALNQGGWDVFGQGTCPDPTGFPQHFYRHYEIPRERYDEIFKKLMEVQDKLVEENIFPTKKNEDKIFPKLEELLRD